MKKGCFIKTVIILTILIAAISYIIQYKIEDWLDKPGRELVYNETIKDFETELNMIADSTKTDSLKSLLAHFFYNAKSLEENVNLEKESFIIKFKKIIADSSITEQEISILTSILKRAEYEKFKSN